MLNEIVKEYRGIQFIFIEEAKELCVEYSRKNRKKNNQKEYMLNDAQTELFRITRGPINPKHWCGDFVVKVTTKEVLAEAKKEYGTD